MESMPSAIHTFTGRMVDPLALASDDICIEDIAHHLSQQCRFSGATRAFYSVAQHACLVSKTVSSAFALDGLLHDASEAYLQDMARPLKLDQRLGQAYRGAEKRAQRAIADKFKLSWPEPGQVKQADTVVLVTEARDLLHGTQDWGYYHDVEPLDTVIIPWSSKTAEKTFLARFEELTS